MQMHPSTWFAMSSPTTATIDVFREVVDYLFITLLDWLEEVS
jgi:hypothetical protein